MKTVVLILSSLASCSTALGQQPNSNTPNYMTCYTGCWKTIDPKDGYLITRSDGSFQMIKPAGAKDTISGTWKIRSVYSIPFKTDVIVLRAKGNKTRKLEIGVASLPAVIYQYQGNDFRKVPCE